MTPNNNVRDVSDIEHYTKACADLRGRLEIAIRALERISDRYNDIGFISDRHQESPLDLGETALDMRDIADSALRRLMLNNPHRES